MAEHCSEPTRQSPDHLEVLRCVTLPAIPTVYGLDDPDEGVQSWVFALPGGQALIVPSEGEATGTGAHRLGPGHQLVGPVPGRRTGTGHHLTPRSVMKEPPQTCTVGRSGQGRFARRCTAAWTRSSVAVRLTRTCCDPVGP